jgi:hypothetical protein
VAELGVGLNWAGELGVGLNWAGELGEVIAGGWFVGGGCPGA